MPFPAPFVRSRWRLARRQLLQLAVAAGFLRPFDAVAAPILESKPESDPLVGLGAWLDTLIPADAAPSATSLGIDAAIVSAADDEASKRLLTAGCRWLQQQASARGGAAFAELTDADREAIAHAASIAAPHSLPRVFFDATWSFATTRYYSQPASWASLGYAGPPQPAGFPDHDRPP